MSIRATILAGALGLPLFAGTALAAETKNLSLADAAKLGDRAAVGTVLNGPAKNIAGAEGAARSSARPSATTRRWSTFFWAQAQMPRPPTPTAQRLALRPPRTGCGHHP